MDNEVSFFSTNSNAENKNTKLGEIEICDYGVEDTQAIEDDKDFGEIDHDLAESINFLFLKEYKAVLEASATLHSKVANSINIYKSTRNINSKRLDALKNDKYIDAVCYYSSVYNSTPTAIRTVIGYMYLMERIKDNANFLHQGNFDIVVNELNSDLDILITSVLSEYQGSRLQAMHDRLGELFCIIERDKLNVDLKDILAKVAYKEKDISIKKEEEPLFYLFKDSIFSTVLNINYVSDLLKSIQEVMKNIKQFDTEADKYIYTLKLLSIVRNTGMPWLEYHCYLKQMYSRMKSTRQPHIIKSIYQNKSDIDDENNHMYTQCTCGEHLDITNMLFEFKLINKSTTIYEDLVRENKEQLKVNLNVDTFSDNGPARIDNVLINSGYMYQYHIVCPKCGRLVMFSKRNNLLLQEILKTFLRSEENTVQNLISEGYATLTPEKIFELDADSDPEFRLDLAIDIADFGENTNVFRYSDFSDFERVARDFLKKLEKKKIEKELVKGSELKFNYGEINPNPNAYLEWFEKNMYQPEHIQFRDKMYKNFLLWFLKTNYNARFDSEALLMYGINYLYSGEIEKYNKSIVDYNKKLKNLRLTESINKKMLEFIGVYNQDDDPDYQPVYDENDIEGNRQLSIDINRLSSFIQRALQIEVDRCFVNKSDDLQIENIQSKFFSLLEDFIDNTNRVSLRLNNTTKMIVFEKIKETLLTEENIKEWADILNGSIKIDEELDDKLRAILKYVGGKQSDTLLDIDYAGLFAEKPKMPTLAKNPNGSSLMMKLNSIAITNLIMELGKSEYMNSVELSDKQISLDDAKHFFDKVIYGEQDDYESINYDNLGSECMFALVKNRLSTLIKSYKDALVKYEAGDKSVDLNKERILPQELIYFIDFMLSKVTIGKDYVAGYMQNKLLTEEALNCDIVMIKKFKNKIGNWYDSNKLDEIVKVLIANRLEAQIYYQLKVNIFFEIQDKIYQLGKQKLLSEIYDNFEGIAIALMESLPLQTTRTRFFGGRFSRKWKFSDINPFTEKDKKQLSVEFYCQKGVPDLALEMVTKSEENNPKAAVSIIWAYIKMLDTNYFISELLKDYESHKIYERDLERQNLVYNLSSMLPFDALFAAIYKLPITEISEDLQKTLDSADCLEFKYEDNELELYRALVFEKNEMYILEYLLGIKESLGYAYGKNTLLLNVIDKVQKINLSGTLLPYKAQNRQI